MAQHCIIRKGELSQQVKIEILIAVNINKTFLIIHYSSENIDLVIELILGLFAHQQVLQLIFQFSCKSQPESYSIQAYLNLT